MTDPESLALRRKRVLYRACHRGTQEMDILIGGYVTARLESLDHPDLDRLEALMEEEETDLQAWLLEQTPPPPGADRALLDAIRAFRLEKAGR